MSHGTPSFRDDIRPLFRDSDIEAMRDAFDLSSFHDVRAHAEAISVRLEEGSMPCDRMWGAHDVALFQEWIAQGMHP